MYAEWYARISEPLARNPRAARVLEVVDKAIVVVLAVAFFASLIWLAGAFEVTDSRVVIAGAATCPVISTVFLRALLVPAISFVAVSIVRARINAPRPYEPRPDEPAYEPIKPLIVKQTTGKSMPSRHVFSAFIIAFELLWLDIAWGVPALICASVLIYTRIVGGLHYPGDVIVAVVVAAVCGLVGFVLIPL